MQSKTKAPAPVIQTTRYSTLEHKRSTIPTAIYKHHQ